MGLPVNAPLKIEDVAEEKFFGTRIKYPLATVKLLLDKKSGFMQLKFDIDGSIQAGCDRCGNTLPLQLWDEFNIIVKMVDEPDTLNEQEEDPDMFYIAQGASHLHIADWVYEFITLSMPMQKQCSEAQIGGVYCNKEVLLTSFMLGSNDATVVPL